MGNFFKDVVQVASPFLPAIGATIGTLVLPGIGTAIGAAIGAGEAELLQDAAGFGGTTGLGPGPACTTCLPGPGTQFSGGPGEVCELKKAGQTSFVTGVTTKIIPWSADFELVCQKIQEAPSLNPAAPPPPTRIGPGAVTEAEFLAGARRPEDVPGILASIQGPAVAPAGFFSLQPQGGFFDPTREGLRNLIDLSTFDLLDLEPGAQGGLSGLIGFDPFRDDEFRPAVSGGDGTRLTGTAGLPTKNLVGSESQPSAGLLQSIREARCACEAVMA